LMFTFAGISNVVYGGGGSPPSGHHGGGENKQDAQRAGGGRASPSASPIASPSASSASQGTNQVTFTCEIFGQPEPIDYDGRQVMGQVVEWNSEHIMVFIDPMQSGDFMLGYPGQHVRVHGEYEGTITTSGGGSYEAVMADSVESVD
jgi:hypothetical protein